MTTPVPSHDSAAGNPDSAESGVNAPHSRTGIPSSRTGAPHLGSTRPTSFGGNLVRGAIMGAVETVPGMSAGTVALVTGVYGRLLDSASHLVSAIKTFLLGPDRLSGARQSLSEVDWKLILPLLIGMAAALFTLAGPISHLVEVHPEPMRALFFGMVLASASVPLRMAGVKDARWYQILSGVIAGAIAFWLVSLTPAAAVHPSPFIIILAAALAVCALLLPGLSGMFVILTFGLYETTLNAVATLDFAYLGIFAIGMVIGLLSIVKGLQWLLTRYHRITLLILTGVMLGAARSLWPWQTADRVLEGPGANWPLALLLGLIGFTVVATFAYVDARLTNKQLAAMEAREVLAEERR